MVNIKEIDKVIDNLTDFISESIGEVSDQDDYMVIIGNNMKGVMYYDKKRYSLYFDKNTLEKDIDGTFPKNVAKYKKEAIKKYFKNNYPNLSVKKITSSYLTVD